jgi:hypothetical protein
VEEGVSRYLAKCLGYDVWTRELAYSLKMSGKWRVKEGVSRYLENVWKMKG